ncbi:MAG: hypothetical protein QOF12_1087, partial [Solirubrobacteraceae bacterium]|nr:hypothetical protein [Solirubrobacteraceae bacterium]
MRRLATIALALATLTAGCGGGSGSAPTAGAPASAGDPASSATAAGTVLVPRAGRIPPLLDRANVYAAERPGLLSPTVRNDPPRVYVPNSMSNTVDVVDQRTGRVIDHWATGSLPQHVTPSWDLR